MKYFQNKAAEAKAEKQAEKAKAESEAPDWVSEKNASFEAWKLVLAMKKEKEEYIRKHDKVNDYRKQANYQIKGAEVAKKLGLNRATLMNTSTYSKALSEFIDQINEQLESAKEAKLTKQREDPSRGAIKTSKVTLAEEVKALKKRIKELENQNIEALVKASFDQLTLPVRRKAQAAIERLR